MRSDADRDLEFFDPIVDGKPHKTLRRHRHACGVYVIRKRSPARRILYVGESHTGRLLKTVMRHFYPWKDEPERPHHTYSAPLVEICVIPTASSLAVTVQNELIHQFDPRDNRLTPA